MRLIFSTKVHASQVTTTCIHPKTYNRLKLQYMQYMSERTLKGVNRQDNRLKLFVSKNLNCQASPVRPVRLTGQAGPRLCLADGTGHTPANTTSSSS
jgi:hypothetical protein